MVFLVREEVVVGRKEEGVFPLTLGVTVYSLSKNLIDFFFKIHKLFSYLFLYLFIIIIIYFF